MKKKKSYHHKNLKPELLALTSRMIAEEGLGSVTLRELARRLDVSRTAPYRHFKDKNALLATVAEQELQSLNLALLAVFEVPHGPLLQLKQMAVTYLRFAVSHYELYRLVFRDELQKGDRYPGLAEASDETFAILVQCVQQAQEAGTVATGDATMLAYTAWSTLHGLVELLMEGKLAGVTDRDAFFVFTAGTMISGLEVR